MSKQTPKQQVEARFGTRVDLVKAIMKMTGGDDDTRSALMGTTNKKLLRIHDAAAEADKRFGGKSGLLDAIAQLQFPGGKPNPGWREKYEEYTVKRLLDVHRQVKSKAAKRG